MRKKIFKMLLNGFITFFLNVWFISFFIVTMLIRVSSQIENSGLKLIYLVIVWFLFLFNIKQYLYHIEKPDIFTRTLIETLDLEDEE